MSTSNVAVKWAERKATLFITVEAKDATDVKVTFEDDRVMACGFGVTKVGGAAGEEFNVELQLFKHIDVVQSNFAVRGGAIQILAVKDYAGDYWEKLTTEKPKQLKQWLSCDWALWKDEEDEEEDEKVQFGEMGDMREMMSNDPGAALRADREENQAREAAQKQEQGGDDDEMEDDEESDMDRAAMAEMMRDMQA